MTTIVAGWTERAADRQTNKRWGLLRFTHALRQWQGEIARRRLVTQILNETRDPRILDDLGIAGPRKDDVELFIASMLWHQH